MKNLHPQSINTAYNTQMESRFLQMTYSARLDDFGLEFASWFTNGQGCFQPAYDLAVPCGIPSYYSSDPPAVCPSEGHTFWNSPGKFDRLRRKVERLTFESYFANFSTDPPILKDKALFGLHAAGIGSWTARIFHYLFRCLIPVVATDGVILPYERVLNYRQFTNKILSSSYAPRNSRGVLMKAISQPIRVLEQVLSYTLFCMSSPSVTFSSSLCFLLVLLCLSVCRTLFLLHSFSFRYFQLPNFSLISNILAHMFNNNYNNNRLPSPRTLAVTIPLLRPKGTHL